jgi:hypothetical protein
MTAILFTTELPNKITGLRHDREHAFRHISFNFGRLSNLSINVSVKALAVSNRNLKRPFIGNDDKHFAQAVLKDRAPPAHFQMALDFGP